MHQRAQHFAIARDFIFERVGSEAVVEAYDADGKVADRVSREKVPERTGPDQPIPSFDVTVRAPAIAYIRFSGAPPGGYLVCDEVRSFLCAFT